MPALKNCCPLCKSEIFGRQERVKCAGVCASTFHMICVLDFPKDWGISNDKKKKLKLCLKGSFICVSCSYKNTKECEGNSEQDGVSVNENQNCLRGNNNELSNELQLSKDTHIKTHISVNSEENNFNSTTTNFCDCSCEQKVNLVLEKIDYLFIDNLKLKENYNLLRKSYEAILQLQSEVSEFKLCSLSKPVVEKPENDNQQCGLKDCPADNKICFINRAAPKGTLLFAADTCEPQLSNLKHSSYLDFDYDENDQTKDRVIKSATRESTGGISKYQVYDSAVSDVGESILTVRKSELAATNFDKSNNDKNKSDMTHLNYKETVKTGCRRKQNFNKDCLPNSQPRRQDFAVTDVGESILTVRKSECAAINFAKSNSDKKKSDLTHLNYKETVKNGCGKEQNLNRDCLPNTKPRRENFDRTLKLVDNRNVFKVTGLINNELDRSSIFVNSRFSETRAIFVTRFRAGIQASDVYNILFKNDYQFNTFICTKIKTRYSSYSSFHIAIDNSDYPLICNKNFWPEGILILPFKGRLYPNNIFGQNLNSYYQDMNGNLSVFDISLNKQNLITGNRSTYIKSSSEENCISGGRDINDHLNASYSSDSSWATIDQVGFEDEDILDIKKDIFPQFHLDKKSVNLGESTLIQPVYIPHCIGETIDTVKISTSLKSSTGDVSSGLNDDSRDNCRKNKILIRSNSENTCVLDLEMSTFGNTTAIAEVNLEGLHDIRNDDYINNI